MTSRIDFADLKERLRIRAREIVPRWLPGGKIVGSEYEVGSLAGGKGKSLKINLTHGVWADFATGEKGGDLIALYAARMGLTQSEAARRILEEFGEAVMTAPRPEPQSKPKPKTLVPPPPGAPEPPFQHARFGAPTATWCYRDGAGAPLFYVARYDPPGERKQFNPIVWDGAAWSRSAPPSPRPLYGLDRLGEKLNYRVVVCEGERAADAAQKLMGQHYVAVTWSGGATAWKQTDWGPLKGRAVLLWPDADDVGISSMRALGTEILTTICPEVKLIDALQGHAGGWDAADAEERDNWTYADVRAWATSRVELLAKPIEPETLPAPASAELPYDPEKYNAAYFDFLHKNKSGTPLGTYDNFQILMKELNYIIRYNVISKREEILLPSANSFSIDNQQVASLAVVKSKCAEARIPVQHLNDYVTRMADHNQFNPIARWIESKPWDGTSRLKSFFNTIKAKEEDLSTQVLVLKETLMLRWLISAVACVFRPDGLAAQGVLVLQGAQGVGKTRWFKRLVDDIVRQYIREGVILAPSDKDSVKQAVSYWIVELGELDATFKRAEMAQLKAFLTNGIDVLRNPYAARESTYPRRTVFMATVNPEQFLHDPSGARRFWTIACEDIDYEHDLDMQQVWAEVLVQYRAEPNSFFLTPDELEALNEYNKGFVTRDAVEELLGSKLDWKADPSLWTFRTSTDVLVELGFVRPTQGEIRRCTAELVKHRGCEYDKNHPEGRAIKAPPKVGGRQTTFRPSLSFESQ